MPKRPFSGNRPENHKSHEKNNSGPLKFYKKLFHGCQTQAKGHRLVTIVPLNHKRCQLADQGNGDKIDTGWPNTNKFTSREGLNLT
jgi:hypothetical protein